MLDSITPEQWTALIAWAIVNLGANLRPLLEDVAAIFAGFTAATDPDSPGGKKIVDAEWLGLIPLLFQGLWALVKLLGVTGYSMIAPRWITRLGFLRRLKS